MSKKVLIVGGGIIGICSAYFLKKDGFDVTIVTTAKTDEEALALLKGLGMPLVTF